MDYRQYGLIRASKLPPNRYYDAAEEDRAIPGTILPISVGDEGKSPVVQKALSTVNFNPSESGNGGIEIDLTKVTSQDRDVAARIAATEFPDDYRQQFIRKMEILSEIAAERTAGKAVAFKPKGDQKVAPVKKKASATEQRAAWRPSKTIAELLESTVETSQPAKPPRRVIVELPQMAGQITCYYHDVVWTNDVLVLVRQDSATNIGWSPAVSSDADVPQETNLVVYRPDGTPEIAFAAMATPIVFPYAGLTFCALIILKSREIGPGGMAEVEQTGEPEDADEDGVAGFGAGW